MARLRLTSSDTVQDLPPGRFRLAASDVVADVAPATTAAPITPERQAEIDSKVRSGLFPVQGMSPDEAYANALSSNVTPTVSPWKSAAAGAVQGLSQGFGDEIAAATQAALGHVGLTEKKTYRQWRDEFRDALKYSSEANPKAALLGEVAGGVATAALPGAAAAKGGNALSAVGKFGQVFSQAAKEGALYGLGDSTADLTQGDLGGALKDAAVSGVTAGALGAAGHAVVKGVPWAAKALKGVGFEGLGDLASGAEGRVKSRMLRDIVGGEGAETTAKASTMRALEARGGHEGEELARVARETGLEKSFATQAMTAPASVAKKTGKAISKLGDRMDAIYEQVGEVPISSAITEMDDLQQKLLRQGFVKEAAIVEQYAAPYVKKLAKEPTATIEASALRNMRQEIGQEAFRGDRGAPNIPTKARREVYGAFSRIIEDAAQKVEGVDVAELKDLNRQMSILLPARDALVERGAKEHAGRFSLSHIGQHAIGATLGGVAGFEGMGEDLGFEGIKGVAGGAALGGALLLGGKKLAGTLGRRMDYRLATIMKAAANGSTKAQLADMAVRLGIPVAVGSRIAARMGAPDRPGEAEPVLSGALPDSAEPTVVPAEE